MTACILKDPHGSGVMKKKINVIIQRLHLCDNGWQANLRAMAFEISFLIIILGQAPCVDVYWSKLNSAQGQFRGAISGDLTKMKLYRKIILISVRISNTGKLEIF